MLFILNEMQTLSVKDLEHLFITPILTIRFISRNYQCYSINMYTFQESFAFIHILMCMIQENVRYKFTHNTCNMVNSINMARAKRFTGLLP